jgi:D-glycero-D-manno-heptose 1,7-bisphosphate phosphatase
MLEPIRVGAGRPHVGRGPAAVFLDRDGVLNDVPGDGLSARSPRHVSEVSIALDAPAAVAELREHGFLLVMVTNQPDVARGALEPDDAIAITRAVLEPLRLDDAFICMHDGSDGCECRKPRAGLLVAAAAAHEIDLSRSWLIGDRWVDVAAARAAGVRSVLIERAYSWDPSGGISAPNDCEPDVRVSSLHDAVIELGGTDA